MCGCSDRWLPWKEESVCWSPSLPCEPPCYDGVPEGCECVAVKHSVLYWLGLSAEGPHHTPHAPSTGAPSVKEQRLQLFIAFFDEAAALAGAGRRVCARHKDVLIHLCAVLGILALSDPHWGWHGPVSSWFQQGTGTFQNQNALQTCTRALTLMLLQAFLQTALVALLSSCTWLRACIDMFVSGSLNEIMCDTQGSLALDKAKIWSTSRHFNNAKAADGGASWLFAASVKTSGCPIWIFQWPSPHQYLESRLADGWN